MAGERILIVDDHPANLKLAAVTLEAEGYLVRVAIDGHQALAIVANFHPRLILMDLQLPGIDGLELTRRLKADPATRDIRIIAVTAYAMKGDQEKAMAAGCDGYLTKPLDPLRLPTMVAAQVEGGDGSPDPRPPENCTTILVIEDNPVTRKMIRVALQAHGFAVVEAADGAEATLAVSEQIPDLVLQDLILPDVDGLELVLRLRARVGAGVPIICLTGFLSRLDEIEAFRGGFSAVLLKPVDPIQLIEMVTTHLAQRNDPRALVGNGHHVAVIDDDPLQRKLAQFYLTNAGFRVSLFADGAAFLTDGATVRPAVIVSDVLMPGLDGFQVCLEIRHDKALFNVPVVLVSAHYIEEADRALARKVGASALVSRTPEWESVVQAIHEAAGVAPPPPVFESDGLEVGDHTRRILSQLERQAAQSTGLAQRCTLQAAQLAVLAGTAEALARNQKMDGVLGDVLGACLDMAGISKGALYLSDANGRLRLRERIGFTEAERDELERCFGHSRLVREVLASGKVAAFPSRAVAEDLSRELLFAFGVTSALVVPVVWGKEVQGALLLGARLADILADESLAFARVLGLQMAQALGLAQTFDRLTLAERRYRTLMEGAHDAVCVLTPAGKVLEVNRRWEELLQVPREQIVGRTIADFAVPDQEKQGTAAWAAGKSGDAGWTQDLRVKRADGSVALLEVANVVLEIGGERVVFAIGRDITEQTWARAQLMESDRMASVGLLASGVAHEINNPLAAVISNLELAALEVGKLAHNGVRAPALEEELQDAREAADRVRHVALDLRSFARAEDEQVGEIDLRRVLESSLRMAGNEIRHRARVVKRYEEVRPVLGNESRMGQAILNLLVNAAQAIEEGHAEVNAIRLTLKMDGADHVLIEIADTGSGISTENLRHLFTPFFTTKPPGVGTGLGLSITQRIIAAAGGEIAVDSEVGAGTTFRVRLPAAAMPVAQVPPPGVGRPQPIRSGRILVVDDDAIVARAIERTLASEHQVVTMTSARNALEKIEAGDRFDVILCDLMMPQMSGIDLHAELKNIAPDQAARIVFLTGGTFTPRGRAFLDQVPNSRIEKPFDIHLLRALVVDRIAATPLS